MNRRFGPRSLKFPVQPLAEFPDEFGFGKEVERWRERASVLEVVDPEFGSRKLPLHVTIVLETGHASFPRFMGLARLNNADVDLLKAVAHHGDEHVEEHHHRSDDVGPEEEIADDHRQNVVLRVRRDEVHVDAEVAVVDLRR